MFALALFGSIVTRSCEREEKHYRCCATINARPNRDIHTPSSRGKSSSGVKTPWIKQDNNEPQQQNLNKRRVSSPGATIKPVSYRPFSRPPHRPRDPAPAPRSNTVFQASSAQAKRWAKGQHQGIEVRRNGDFWQSRTKCQRCSFSLSPIGKSLLLYSKLSHQISKFKFHFHELITKQD